jgi:hypothetical protein
MSIVKSIGEQVRSSVSFLAFQGKNPDFELMKEVFDALKTFIESENCEKINKVAWKIDHKYIASEEFSFIGMDQHKFVCSILLYVFCRFYRSKYNKHGNELIKIMDMMINGAPRNEIDDIVITLNSTYYYNDEIMAYSVKCNKILNMAPEEFMTSTMEDMGFDGIASSEDS